MPDLVYYEKYNPKFLGLCGYTHCKRPVYETQPYVDHRDLGKMPDDDRLWHYVCYAYDLGIDNDVREDQAYQAERFGSDLDGLELEYE